MAIDTLPGPIKPGTTATVKYLYSVGGFEPITFTRAREWPRATNAS